jgi:hypothetical protein
MKTGIFLLCLLLIVGCTKKQETENTTEQDAATMEQPVETEAPGTVQLLMVEATALDENPMFKEGTVQVIAVAVLDANGEDALRLAMEKIEPMGYGEMKVKSQDAIHLADLTPDDPKLELCRAARESGFSMAVFDLQEEDRKEPAETGGQ